MNTPGTVFVAQKEAAFYAPLLFSSMRCMQ